MIKQMKILFVAALAVSIVGCAGTRVSRVDSDQEIALSDRWNDKDSQLVAEEMIADMLSFPWARDFELKNNNRPTIIIQRIANKSHEHIAIETFVNDIKRSIIRSGRADFVAGGDERKAIRDERQDQELNAAQAKEQGQEQAADFAISGSLNSIVDQVGGDRVTFYQVDMKLIDILITVKFGMGRRKSKNYKKKAALVFK
jgi:hypothetical protein